MYSKLKRYCISILYTLALIPVSLVVIIFAVRLFYICQNNYLNIVIALGAFTLAGFLGSKLQKLRRSISIAVCVFLASLLVGSIYVSSFNCARCIPTTLAVDISLRQILPATVERYYSNSGFSYESFCEDKNLLDLEGKIKSQMKGNSRRCYGPVLAYLIPKKSMDNLFVCNANSLNYAVEAYRHDEERFVCMDNSGALVYNQESIGKAVSCIR